VKRLLTIAHSYVVAQNRRLAHEMAVAGRGRWTVTAAAPSEYPGDLRRISLERFDGEACEVVSLRTRGAKMPHVMVYRGLRPLLEQPWDVIHVWEEPYVAAAAQIARRVTSQPRFVFATFQNIGKDYPFPFAAFERRVLQRADGWIAFGRTAHETQVGRDSRYATLPSRVIPPGVDTHAFAPSIARRRTARQALGWDDEVPVVGFLGRFVPEKGIRILIEALAAVRVPWRALFVGGGPDATAIEPFAAAHPGRVAVLTGVAHDAVPGWLNAMDVLCAPSQTTPRWREQFGRMLVEGMACGVPVLASASGEIPHVLGDAGIVLPEGDAPGWTRAIEGLLTDVALRKTYAARGRARAEDGFAWPAVAARHLEFFEALA
jgi:glycosyltransferase involved in cell wall biosynthesis